MSKIKDENYYQISGWMINKLKLKGNALNIYAIIFGFTQDGQNFFTGSRQYLCDFTGATKPTIDKALDELVERNLIIKYSETINNVLFNKYRVNFEALDFTTSKETLPPSKETLQESSKETLPNNINNKDNNINNNYIVVLEYLNEKTGANFRPIDTNLKLIKARMQDYTEQDLKNVIDKKVKEWKGTEMQQYLRPKTLFNATNFENYVNSLENLSINKNNFIHNNYTKQQISSLISDLDSVEV